MALFRLKPYPLIERPSFSEKVPSKVRTRIEDFNRAKRRAYLRKVVPPGDFPIVACNCWGAGIYQDLDRPFTSPFIGLYLPVPCFLKYLNNYEKARVAPLSFTDTSRFNPAPKYPVGILLDDIELHFVHYENREVAKDKWQRRSQRLPENPNDAYFELGIGNETLEEKEAFLALPFRSKVLFSHQPTPGFDRELVVPPWRGSGMMEGPQLYDGCHARFDVVKWLNREV